VPEVERTRAALADARAAAAAQAASTDCCDAFVAARTIERVEKLLDDLEPSLASIDRLKRAEAAAGAAAASRSPAALGPGTGAHATLLARLADPPSFPAGSERSTGAAPAERDAFGVGHKGPLYAAQTRASPVKPLPSASRPLPEPLSPGVGLDVEAEVAAMGSPPRRRPSPGPPDAAGHGPGGTLRDAFPEAARAGHLAGASEISARDAAALAAMRSLKEGGIEALMRESLLNAGLGTPL
jgi:hypothetical protein